MMDAANQTLLLVDDEENFREIFSARLAAEGYRVETASDGEEAIEKARTIKPDLILMDVKMPKLNGIQATLKLRDDPATKDLKVVLLTNFGDPHPIDGEFQSSLPKEVNAIGFVPKTEDLEAIVARVKSFLAQ